MPVAARTRGPRGADQPHIRTASRATFRTGGPRLAYSLLDRSSLTDAAIAELRIEADALQPAMTIAAHRIDGVDELVSECLSRTEDLRPWIVAGAADIATFAAIYRFASGGARRMQDSAAPHYERITDRTTRWTDTASPASRRTSNSTSPRPRTVSGGPSASPGARVAPFAGDPAGQRAARRPAVRPERDRREQQRQGRPRAAPGTAPAGRLPVVSGPRPGGRGRPGAGRRDLRSPRAHPTPVGWRAPGRPDPRGRSGQAGRRSMASGVAADPEYLPGGRTRRRAPAVAARSGRVAAARARECARDGERGDPHMVGEPGVGADLGDGPADRDR